VSLDPEVERELELVLNRVGGPAARLARRVIRAQRLRAPLRAIAYSRPAAAVLRVWSRRTNRYARNS
jgi:hypothetical protein